MPYRDPDKQRAAGRESAARRSQAWRAKGLCCSCGKRPPAPGRVRCEPCLQKHREAERRSKQRQADRIAGRPVALKKPKPKRAPKPAKPIFKRDPEELRQLARDGLTKAEVARKLGITDGRVNQLAIAHGIEFISHFEKRRKAKGQEPAPARAVTVPAAEIVAATPVAAPPAPKPKPKPKPKRKRVVRKRPPAAPPAPVEPPEVAKHNGHLPPVPEPGNRRQELPRCAMDNCGRRMDAGRAAAQMRKHPGSDLWPQCRDCEQRIARHVIGIRASRAARNDMLDRVEAEGDALPIDDVEHGGEPGETP